MEGKITLSKTQYLRALQCLKSLWLYRNRKDLIPEVPPSKQLLFDQGHETGRLAQKYFPGGKLIENEHTDIPGAIKATESAINGDVRILYEAAFLFDGVIIRADMLVHHKDTAWDLIEVKSTTEIKDVHIPDLAVQSYVLKGAGIRVRKAMLMYVDNQYVRKGEIDVKKLFKLEDITEQVSALLREIKVNVRAFREAAVLKDAPPIEPGPHCNKPYDCEFSDYCLKDVPDYSIYDLARISWDKIEELKSKGIILIKDVPDDFPLNKAQRIQVEVEKTGKPRLEPEAILELLKGLSYPQYFLDFETVNPAIPPYDGLRPYQHLPFEASVHVQRKEKGKIEHVEYLGDGKTDPRPGLVSFLIKSLGSKGPIIAYNAAFEGGRLKDLANGYPGQARQLFSMEKRLWDVANPFKKKFFVHPGFKGRWSMKAVLPALVPSMTYKDMPIADGGEAQTAYLNMMCGKLSPAETRKTANNLRKYCGQDTLGMVALLDELKRNTA